MRWYINDLSLAGQFWNEADFLEQLRRVLALRSRPDLRILVTRTLTERMVTPQRRFREVVQGIRDERIRNIAFRWLANDGPFLEDDRQDNPDDYFEYHAHDVTDRVWERPHGAFSPARRPEPSVSTAVPRLLVPYRHCLFSTGCRKHRSATCRSTMHGMPTMWPRPHARQRRRHGTGRGPWR